jgi:hypothetical protein
MSSQSTPLTSRTLIGCAPFKDFEEKHAFVMDLTVLDFSQGSIEGWRKMESNLKDYRYITGIVEPAQLREGLEAVLRTGMKTNTESSDDSEPSDELRQLVQSTVEHLYWRCDWGTKPRPATYQAFEKSINRYPPAQWAATTSTSQSANSALSQQPETGPLGPGLERRLNVWRRSGPSTREGPRGTWREF